jgi:hypothetical protein
MPIRVTPAAGGGQLYTRVLHGPALNLAQIGVNLATLAVGDIDEEGYIIPGVLVAADGTSVGAGQYAFGVVPEPIKVANSGLNADIVAAGIVQLGLVTFGQVIRAAAEDNLGRAYDANELASFALAGSTLKLL